MSYIVFKPGIGWYCLVSPKHQVSLPIWFQYHEGIITIQFWWFFVCLILSRYQFWQFSQNLECLVWTWQYKESEAGLLNKSSCLAPALGVTKFIIVINMILVTLCCATKVRLSCSTNPPKAPIANLILGHLKQFCFGIWCKIGFKTGKN